MDPLREDLVWRRNAPEQVRYALADGDTPVSFVEYALRMQVRLYPGAPGDPLLDLGMAAANTPGFYFDDAANGRFTFTPPTVDQLQAMIAPADLASGIVSGLAYDTLLIPPVGPPEAFMYGTVTLLSGATRL